jgi:NADH-quinone oxidoreductase subunit N
MGIENLQDVQAALGVIRPELMLSGTVLLCILLDLFGSQENKNACWVVSFLGCLLALLSSLHAWGTQGSAFYDLVRMDNLSHFFHGLFLFAGILTLLMSGAFVRREALPPGEYCTLLLLCLTGMLFMAQANDLITVFLGLEIMSIPIYVLSGMLRTNPRSPEAGLKYLLLGAFASAFLLFGMALLYGAAGTTRLDALLVYAPRAVADADLLFFAGLGFILVGLGFKVSLVPFHMWTPDVYEGAPTPITGFMSVAVKAAGFVLLIRVVVLALNPLSVDWSVLFAWLAVLTMVLGNVVALVQENIKRMLAYSSIAHAGYVLLALTPGSEAGLQAALVYLSIYTLMNLGAFAVVISLSRDGDLGTQIRDYAGLARRHPLLALAMAVFMFSLAGVPPTGGFIGKFYAFGAAVQAGYIGLAVIGVLMSAVSAYFYLRVLVVMYMQEPEPNPDPRATPRPPALCDTPAGNSRLLALSLALCALSVILLGLWPGGLTRIAGQAVRGILPLL